MSTCPCGKGGRHTCALCSRRVCEWHSAGMPDGVKTAPVCFPACDEPWWLTPRDGMSSPAESDEESDATKAHARRLLLRGADPEAVASELGLSVQWVRSEARKVSVEVRR